MMLFAHGPSSTPPPPPAPEEYRPAAHMDPATTHHQQQQQHRIRRKRKADTQDTNNERLSKRLSLLNLEQSGSKLYVPVENPKPTSRSPLLSQQPPPASSAPSSTDCDDTMQLDDSKYKVYIYNIDDELSSDSEVEDGKLVFLPDIEKHMRINRMPIPPPILPNSDGELAGMQLVLYNVPSSITVPEEQDSVRKAIIESRARIRAKQKGEGEGAVGTEARSPPTQTPLADFKPIQLDTIPEIPNGVAASPQASQFWQASGAEEDADAMEID